MNKMIKTIFMSGVLLGFSLNAKVYDVTTDYDNNSSTPSVVPNDGNDDRSTLQAAIDYVGSQGGGVLYLPAGVYDVYNTLTESASGSQDLTIKGDGDNATIIKSRNYGTLLDFEFDDRDENLVLEDITLKAGAWYNNGTAVRVAYNPENQSNHRDRGFVANRLHILSADYQYFSKGIIIDHGWNSQITNCLISGRNSSTGTGIEFTSRSVNSIVESTEVNHFGTGISVLSTSSEQQEGIRIDNSLIVDINVGVYGNGGGSNNLWLNFTNGHIDARGLNARCIQLEGKWYDVHCSDNILICAVPDGPSPSYSYHFIGDVNRSVISGNTCYGGSVDNSGGVILEGTSQNNIISNNIFYEMPTSYAVWLKYDTSGNDVKSNRVSQNLFTSTCPYTVFDQRGDPSVNDVLDNSDF